jgi:AraC-like DNA-binding protein
MKNCNTCKQEKSIEDFYKGHSRCKTCALKSMKEYRAANPEAIRQGQMKWKANNEGHTYLDPSGYVIYIGYKHPAANVSGVTREHRIVLWDKLEGQDAPCNWCGMDLKWGVNLVADHLNWDRADNRPENLVPSCQPCNGKRRDPALAQGPCKGPDCSKKAKAKGYCQSHYTQAWSGKEVRPVQKRTEPETRALIVKDIQAGMAIEGVAKKYNFNVSVISRQFKRETGMTIMEWRRMHKVGVAA